MMLSDEEKMQVAWHCAALPEVLNEKTILVFSSMIERAVLAKASQQVKGEPVQSIQHWAIKNPGAADQFRCEARACRKALGFNPDADDISPNDLKKAISDLAMPAPKQEPVDNPHEWIIEKMSYHAFERNDLNIDGCLSYLASGWKEIQGRTERQLVMQILSLLARPAPAQAAAIPEEMTKIKSLDLIPEIDDDYGSNLFVRGWNDCRAAMLSEAPKPEMVRITNEDADK